MTFEEKTLKSERIYEGAIINLRRDKVTVQHGTSYREIVEHNGGAVLAAVTDRGRLVMVRQFRKPAERVMLEVPAGKIDPGEKPEGAAPDILRRREGAEQGGVSQALAGGSKKAAASPHPGDDLRHGDPGIGTAVFHGGGGEAGSDHGALQEQDPHHFASWKAAEEAPGVRPGARDLFRGDLCHA